jgi:signal transduction histidine kinase
VDIYFKEIDGSLQVEIADNGTPPKDLVMGKGLWGMKERANLIGGDLVYNSGAHGFTLTLTVPVAGEENNDA